MSSKGLSRFIPNAVLDAYKPALADGLEMAAFLFMVATWLAVIGNFIYDFSISFDTGLDSFWAGGNTLFISLPVVLVALTIVYRRQAPQASPRGLWLLDASVTLAFLFGLLAIVAGAIGIFSSFANNGFGGVVGDIFFHVADIALGVVVVIWSLNELAAIRKYEPASMTTTVATVATAAPTWGAPAPTAAPPTAAPAPTAPVASAPPTSAATALPQEPPPPPPAGPTAS